MCCLTIDCHSSNSLGPSKFRTSGESGMEQIYYYNRNRKDKSFNHFLALRKETADDSIIFEIAKLVEETKSGSFEYYEINSELEEFNDGRASDIRSIFKRPISEPSGRDFSGGKINRKKTKFLSR